MSLPSKATEVATLELPLGKFDKCRHKDVTFDPSTRRVYSILSDSPNHTAGAIVNAFQIAADGKSFDLMKENIETARVGDIAPMGDGRFVVTLVRRASNWEKQPPWEAYLYDQEWKSTIINTKCVAQPGKDDSWYLAVNQAKNEFCIASPDSNKLHFYKCGQLECSHETVVPKLSRLEKLKFFPNGILAISTRHDIYRWQTKSKNKFDITMLKICPPDQHSDGKDVVKQVGIVKDVSGGCYTMIGDNHILFGRLNHLWKKNEFLTCDWSKPDDTKTVDTTVLNPEPIVPLFHGMIIARVGDEKKKYSILMLN
jgi:hypothetical protein